MKSELEIIKESNQTFDALLDEINKQKRVITQLQSENRALKTTEIRVGKQTESTKSENFSLKEEIMTLTQKVRELEIQLTLPTNERTFVPVKEVELFPKKKWYQTFNWAYIVAPVLAIVSIGIGRYWGIQSAVSAGVQPAALTTSATTTTADNSLAAAIVTPFTTQAANEVIEEGYLKVENPLEPDAMVRVYDGYGRKARVLAFVNPNEKYRIREKSPQKMYRTFVKDGENVTYEDYFYRISDKNQWIFGHFTTMRLNK
jgi:predicted RNase H-like nuclease (RuvC/YqgF family)